MQRNESSCFLLLTAAPAVLTYNYSVPLASRTKRTLRNYGPLNSDESGFNKLITPTKQSQPTHHHIDSASLYAQVSRAFARSQWFADFLTTEFDVNRVSFCWFAVSIEQTTTAVAELPVPIMFVSTFVCNWPFPSEIDPSQNAFSPHRFQQPAISPFFTKWPAESYFKFSNKFQISI